MFHADRSRARPLLTAVGLLFTLSLAALQLFPPVFLVYMEDKTYDALLQATHRSRTSGLVACVDVDEASLKSHGQWPWPRYRVALLLEKIKSLGAASVGLDILFAEPDRISLAYLRTEILRDLGVDIGSGTPPAKALDNDQLLAETLRKGPFVLSYQFQFGDAGGGGCVLHPLTTAYLQLDESESKPAFLAATGVVCNIEKLSRSVPISGFLNVAPDSDGTYRRIPLIIRYRERLYPSLALASVMQALGARQIILSGSGGWIESIRFKNMTIPIDARGNIWIHYRGKRNTFEHFSATDILLDRIPAGELKNKVILVGSSAAGLEMTRATPLDPLEPGLEIHATIADNLLMGDTISRPESARVIELFVILSLGVLFTFLISRSQDRFAAILLPLSIGTLICGSLWMLAKHGIFTSPLLPVLSAGGSFLLLTSLNYREAEKQVRIRTKKLVLTQDAIIQGMASLAEARDGETGGHIQRTKHYVKALAERLIDHPRFRHLLDHHTIDLLFRLAPLHDIGKVAVPDKILLKADKLSEAEYEEMKKHTIVGSKAITQAEELLGDESFLRLAHDFTLAHQEKWDGTGYPQGKKGDEIPMAGRLMAVADAYDAITSKRRYKEMLSHEEAVKIMTKLRGTQFDPDILDAFLEIQEEFRSISQRFDEKGRDVSRKGTGN